MVGKELYTLWNYEYIYFSEPSRRSFDSDTPLKLSTSSFLFPVRKHVSDTLRMITSSHEQM